MGHQVPSHLKKYLVNQNYKKYTPEDQAVWRYIMKGIEQNMKTYGHKNGIAGLKKTGITFDKIPKISEISKKLEKFGWKAVTISGFIPPQAFMEFLYHGILPIASELRTIDHINYTPAPDIVHEAVGHVPFLIYKQYGDFLKKYASVVLKSLSSAEDRKQYIAIRDLSDLKEHPKSTKKQIQKAERALKTITKQISHTSEASYLSRFIWWTSEYGLIGSLKSHKMYGAGLISSIQEARQIPKVKKIMLDETCLKYSYDITRFQPQLFVAKSFSHLSKVLDKISEDLSWKQGGKKAIEKSILSKVVNTVELDSGLQISGITEKLITHKNKICFLKFSGPTQLSFRNKQLPGHGKAYHKEGYSTPLNLITNNKKAMHLWNDKDLKKASIKVGNSVSLKFESGIQLKGDLVKILRKNGNLLVLTFKNCLMKRKKETLFHPSWGMFDLAVGSNVVSVFSGAADQNAYKDRDSFKASKIPKKIYTQKQKSEFQFYTEIDRLKTKIKKSKIKNPRHQKEIDKLIKKLKTKKQAWLQSLELLEAAKKYPKQKAQILEHLSKISKRSSKSIQEMIKEALPFYK